ncbi:MAG: rhamnan synthesis F family protein [Spirochaetota bacterium]
MSTSDKLSPEAIHLIRPLCYKIMLRENIGYDFGSWKCGLLYSGINLRDFDELLLTNDSVYAPMFPLNTVLAGLKADMNGITDSYEINYHIMSYFVLYKKAVFHSENFIQKWRAVRMLPNSLKGLIIELYEIGMSQYFKASGHSLAAWIPVDTLKEKYDLPLDLNKFNSVHMLWRELIRNERCPIMKVDLFSRFIKNGKFSDWKEIVAETKYPIEHILKHQKLI